MLVEAVLATRRRRQPERTANRDGEVLRPSLEPRIQAAMLRRIHLLRKLQAREDHLPGRFGEVGGGLPGALDPFLFRFSSYSSCVLS